MTDVNAIDLNQFDFLGSALAFLCLKLQNIWR